MPFWGWLLIDFGIMLLGAVWWVYLLWNLKNRGERLLKIATPVINQLETMASLQEQGGSYEKPAADLGSDPRKMEAAWLARKAASEQKKRDRQRRLIARLRK